MKYFSALLYIILFFGLTVTFAFPNFRHHRSSHNFIKPASCNKQYRGLSGLINSPTFNIPEPLVCEWNISASDPHHLLLSFDDVNLDNAGCSFAVLEVFAEGKSQLKVCSKKYSGSIYIPKNFANIRFYHSGTKKVETFQISWTSVSPEKECKEPRNFRCELNGYCIDQRLKCNNHKNCGTGDDSDELNCVPQIRVQSPTFHIVNSAAAAGLFMFVFIICYIRMRRTIRRMIIEERERRISTSTFNSVHQRRQHQQPNSEEGDGSSATESIRLLDDASDFQDHPMPPPRYNSTGALKDVHKLKEISFSPPFDNLTGLDMPPPLYKLHQDSTETSASDSAAVQAFSHLPRYKSTSSLTKTL